MLIIIMCILLSTSSLDQGRRIEFCVISRPDVATPPALAALPGPNRIFAFRNTSTASGVEGIFAPSETARHLFLTSSPASSLLISFWVALGNARSHLMLHVRSPSTYLTLYLSA